MIFVSRRPLKIMVFSLLILLLIGSFVSSAYAAKQTNDKKKCALISVEIIDAYYADLDNDGYEDDILGVIRIDKNVVNVANMKYTISLTLPSGTTYTYMVKILTNQETVVLRNFFWDHAYESGNYTLQITLNLINYDKVTVFGTYVFDPPGSSQGGEPTFDVV